MPGNQQKAVRINGSEHGDVSVDLWSVETEPQVHIISLSAGNAHFVVALHSRDCLKMMRDFIVTHRGQAGAEWLEIGNFASCPVNVYSNQNGISLICDGHTIGDFPESFAIYFAGTRLDSFCSVLNDLLLHKD